MYDRNRTYFPTAQRIKIGPMLEIQMIPTFFAKTQEKKNFLSKVSGRKRTAKKKQRSEKHSAAMKSQK
jgi:hypothetical protein